MIPITNTELLSKIHQTYRVQYIQVSITSYLVYFVVILYFMFLPSTRLLSFTEYTFLILVWIKFSRCKPIYVVPLNMTLRNLIEYFPKKSFHHLIWKKFHFVRRGALGGPRTLKQFLWYLKIISTRVCNKIFWIKAKKNFVLAVWKFRTNTFIFE